MPEDPISTHDGYREAERILNAFIDALKAGKPADTAQLCADHPEHADELKALYERWLEASGVLEAAELRHSQVVDAVAAADPRITLDGPESGLASRLLESLTIRDDGSSRYEVRDEVDRGGMGAILRIWDKNLRRELAMKVMLGRFGDSAPGAPVSDVSLGRFLEEAQVTGQLDHPGIVPVHELGLDSEGRVYFTMRLVKGQTLSSIFELARKGREGWTQTRVLGVLLKVCEAMSYAHSKGVVHRDLKPANVMVGQFGEVYVMDWGLSRVIGREHSKDTRPNSPAATTRSLETARRDEARDTPDSPLMTMDGAVVGTPSFMSPEQARGKLEEVDRRSDVYSFGSMLYELLTGQMPFVPEGARVSPHTVLAAVLQGPPPPIDRLTRGIPVELVAICEKAMARDAAERYADMMEIAADLRAYVEGRVVRAYEAGALAEARKWVTRNRGMAASLLAAVTLLVAGLVATVVLRQEALANFELASMNASAAEVARLEAAEQARLAVKRADDVLRLSALHDVQGLVVEARSLWPAHPARIEEYRSWIARAEVLVGEIDAHRRKRDELRMLGLRCLTREGLAEWELLHSDCPAVSNLASHIAILEGWTPINVEVAEDETESTPSLESLIAAAAGCLGHAEWPFHGSERETQWWHDQLSKLVHGLQELEAGLLAEDSVSEGYGWSVSKRLAFASTVEEQTVTGSEVAALWEEAIGSIGELEVYGGLDLSPQLGLVPLGRDPDSGLWEFGNVQTGSLPARGRDGRLVLSEESGLVFVLLPGGAFLMSAQSHDAEQPNYDSAQGHGDPVHEATLSPFLMSKYEMTQGQWKRMVGSNPSAYGPDGEWFRGWRAGGGEPSLLQPVEHVSWYDCMEILKRLGLDLPSEAQWEYGCRGGTTSPYWTGEGLASLEGAANLADDYSRTHHRDWTDWEEGFDDGSTVHAIVGMYRANPFGLHDVHGNVWEWCRDAWDGNAYGPGRSVDQAVTGDGADEHVVRGGSYRNTAVLARSALRYFVPTTLTTPSLGVRPARGIDP